MIDTHAQLATATIHRLSKAQVEACIGRAAIEELGFKVTEDALPPAFVLEAAANAYEVAAGDAVWFAPYAIVDQHGSVVGMGSFKRQPSNGNVEIGYGVAPTTERRGYATLCVKRLLEIAFLSPEIDNVVAETAVDNVASQRVLEKNGFSKTGERVDADDGRLICWIARRPR